MEAAALPSPGPIASRSIPLPPALLRLRSDEQLVALFRAGSDEAYVVIHDRYRPRLLAYCRQMLGGSNADAEDVLQDVFLRVHAALRSSSAPITLRAWLYRIAHNRCIDGLRRPAPQPTELTPGAQPALSRGADHEPPVEAERSEDLRRLVRDLLALPEQQRSALLMRELQGLSYEELAVSLGVSVGAVKSLLVRARGGVLSAAVARDTPCAEIWDELAAAHDRGVRPSGRARRHLRECDGCRRHRTDLRATSKQLAALAPPVGLLGHLGQLGGLGGGGTGGGLAAAGGGAGGGGALCGVAGATAGKVAVLVCAAALVGGAGSALAPSSPDAPPRARPAPAPPARVLVARPVPPLRVKPAVVTTPARTPAAVAPAPAAAVAPPPACPVTSSPAPADPTTSTPGTSSPAPADATTRAPGTNSPPPTATVAEIPSAPPSSTAPTVASPPGPASTAGPTAPPPAEASAGVACPAVAPGPAPAPAAKTGPAPTADPSSSPAVTGPAATTPPAGAAPATLAGSASAQTTGGVAGPAEPNTGAGAADPTATASTATSAPAAADAGRTAAASAR